MEERFMKLAEALNLRSDLQKRIAQLKESLNHNVKVQEGDKPGEKPEKLFAELNELLPQLQDMIIRINNTNCKTVVDGKTLTEWIAERDVLATKLNIYRSAYSNSVIRVERYSRNEIRYVRAIDSEELHKQVDVLSKQYRELDMKLQEANWINELN